MSRGKEEKLLLPLISSKIPIWGASSLLPHFAAHESSSRGDTRPRLCAVSCCSCNCHCNSSIDVNKYEIILERKRAGCGTWQDEAEEEEEEEEDADKDDIDTEWRRRLKVKHETKQQIKQTRRTLFFQRVLSLPASLLLLAEGQLQSSCSLIVLKRERGERN